MDKINSLNLIQLHTRYYRDDPRLPDLLERIPLCQHWWKYQGPHLERDSSEVRCHYWPSADFSGCGTLFCYAYTRSIC